MESQAEGYWGEGAHGGHKRNPPPLPPPAPPSLLPLIISGSLLMLVLRYFHSFSHLYENSSGDKQAHMCLQVEQA